MVVQTVLLYTVVNRPGFREVVDLGGTSRSRDLARKFTNGPQIEFKPGTIRNRT